MPRRLLSVLVAALLVGLGLGACGGGDGGSGTSGPCIDATNGAVTVVAKNLEFRPDCIRTTGSTLQVTLDNQDGSIAHDLVVEGAPEPNGTELSTDDQSVTLEGLEPGSYTFICTVHSNMQGTLEVVAPGGQPAGPAG